MLNTLSVLSSGRKTTSSPSQVKNYFFVCYSLVGLVDTSPVSELGVLGVHLSSESLKSWDASCWVQTLLLIEN